MVAGPAQWRLPQNGPVILPLHWLRPASEDARVADR
jgi:hypothetical protein